MLKALSPGDVVTVTRIDGWRRGVYPGCKVNLR
jgi:hypothetical protein